MALLELSAAELEQKVEAELARNPALELKDAHRCPRCNLLLTDLNTCPRCSPPASRLAEEPIVFVSPVKDFHQGASQDILDLPDDNLPASDEDLPTYVLRQIAFELRPEDRLLAAHILSSLDEDGLLSTPLVEIALYHHVLPSRLESILRLIQRADPVGVGAPSPQAALLVQLEVLAESRPVPPLAYAAISQGMDLLSRHQYSELGRLINASTRQVEQVARFIADNLNPFPARAFWGDIHQGKGEAPQVYSSPDVLISCLDKDPHSPFLVEIVSPYAGLLRVNALFRSAISQAPEEKSDQWRSDLEQAELLVKCLQQRTNTMVRLCTRLAVLQREFILHGDERLVPLTRAVLADELQVHESTISRAVSGKSVQLPSGHIVPLARFFDRSLHIRTVLKQIIEQEQIPLSDSELVELLNRQGYSVARRTVAKYRAMEGILPSHLRQSPAIPSSL
jgi:RNA polymerase sigma-54 factor